MRSWLEMTDEPSGTQDELDELIRVELGDIKMDDTDKPPAHAPEVDKQMSSSSSSSQTILLPTHYEVHAIKNHRLIEDGKNKNFEYLVEWVGFPHEDDFTYQRASHFAGKEAKKLLSEYREMWGI